jgi:serine palmitoyltransferase
MVFDVSRGADFFMQAKKQASKVDIIAASLCNAIGSAGGFCAGSHEIIHHQRLSGQAYTFSASLPAILAVTGIETLGLLAIEYGKVQPKLLENVATMFSHLQQVGPRVCLSGGEKGSPIIHLRLASRITPRIEEEKILQEIVDTVRVLDETSKGMMLMSLKVHPRWCSRGSS